MLEAARTLRDVNRRSAADERLALADVKAAVPGDSRYFADNVHYTDAGADAVEQGAAGAPIRPHLLDAEVAP